MVLSKLSNDNSTLAEIDCKLSSSERVNRTWCCMLYFFTLFYSQVTANTLTV